MEKIEQEKCDREEELREMTYKLKYRFDHIQIYSYYDLIYFIILDEIIIIARTDHLHQDQIQDRDRYQDQADHSLQTLHKTLVKTKLIC